jgi:hypothetical protein
MVEVPHADDMDDDTFIKHLERRHAAECKIEETPMSRRAMSAWIGSYRAFHDRLHQIEVPKQYKHYHAEEEDS